MAEALRKAAPSALALGCHGPLPRHAVQEAPRGLAVHAVQQVPVPARHCEDAPPTAEGAPAARASCVPPAPVSGSSRDTPPTAEAAASQASALALLPLCPVYPNTQCHQEQLPLACCNVPPPPPAQQAGVAPHRDRQQHQGSADAPPELLQPTALMPRLPAAAQPSPEGAARDAGLPPVEERQLGALPPVESRALRLQGSQGSGDALAAGLRVVDLGLQALGLQLQAAQAAQRRLLRLLLRRGAASLLQLVRADACQRPGRAGAAWGAGILHCLPELEHAQVAFACSLLKLPLGPDRRLQLV
mmetsp:Transcript_97824/g.304184  ORF Transcript_97824/g.304184 Transcript_97824/m.304184 type:complete len:302 (+) Transcript_97824:1320-2225(+)